MEGAWPIIFLAVVLKIPVFFGLWLVWWAVRAEPLPDDAPGTGEEHPFRRWRREPRGPRWPRRGPHGGAARAQPKCPPGGRTRVTAPAQPIPALSATDSGCKAAHLRSAGKSRSDLSWAAAASRD